MRIIALGVGAVLVLGLSGCAEEQSRRASEPSSPTSTPPSPSSPPSTTREPPPALMPDLIGLPSNEVATRMGRVERNNGIETWGDWRLPVTVDCATRPGTVVRQHPPPGAELRDGQGIRIRTAALDLASFRGPCEPEGGELGPVKGRDAEIARSFYRFAADPTRDAPFAATAIWVGIEGGPTAVHLDAESRTDPAAWAIGRFYAEREGPFSALDVVALSGGYYELRHGIPDTVCTSHDVPAELAGLRVLTLSAPEDVTGACMEWWGVTLFLDANDLIRGVALRLGSP